MTFHYSYKTVVRETDCVAQGQGLGDQLTTNDNDIKTLSDIYQPRFPALQVKSVDHKSKVNHRENTLDAPKISYKLCRRFQNSQLQGRCLMKSSVKFHE